MNESAPDRSVRANRLPPPEMASLEGWVTVKEAARLLGLSRSAVRNHLQAGRLGLVRRAGAARVDLLSYAAVETFRCSRETADSAGDPVPPAPSPRAREAGQRLVRVVLPQSVYQEANYLARHSGITFNDYFVWALRHLAASHDHSATRLSDAWESLMRQTGAADTR